MGWAFSPTRILAFMDEQGIGTVRLAARIRALDPAIYCRKQTVQSWLYDGVIPGGNYIPVIAAALGKTMDDLYDQTGTSTLEILARVGRNVTGPRAGGRSGPDADQRTSRPWPGR